MKKPKHHTLQRQLRASTREMEKRTYRRDLGSDYGALVRQQNRRFPSGAWHSFPTDVSKIVLRGPLDLVQFPHATLEILNQLEHKDLFSPAHRRLLICLKEVASLDAGALLYLCSRVHELSRFPFVKVCGTWPTEEQPLRVLRDADFAGFLRDRSAPPKFLHNIPQSRSVKLAQGTTKGNRQVNPEIAKSIRSFLQSRHPGLTQEEDDAIGLAVVECLENVRVHAYDDRATARKSGWYVVGLWDEAALTSSVAILDLGKGIAATIKRQMAFPFIPELKSNADYLEEATKGIRTRTGQSNRGQGFRYLREFVGDGTGRYLHVLSSSAMVSWGRQGLIQKKAIGTLRGTIVCLQISNKSSRGTYP